MGFRIHKFFFSILFLLEIGIGNPIQKPNLDIPSTDPSIEILRRAQTRAGLLFPIQSFPQKGAALRTQFGDEVFSSFESIYLENWYPAHGKELIQWQDSTRSRSFFLSPVMDANYQYTSHSNISAKGGLGLTVYGQATSRVTFFSHGVVYTEKTNRAQFGHQFDPAYGETSTVEKGANDSLLKDRTFNRFENYILVDFPWITVKFGRDRLRMGPGYFSSMMVSKDTPPYNLIEGRIDFAPWLKLDDYLVKMTDTRYEIQKYANIHRFEFKPNPSLELAFQDIVIYQNRDPDPVYILPLAPLTFSEANNGGLDNAAMGFDLMYAGIRNFSIWSELFIDDLLGPTSFFNDFWENRWAYLAGLQWTLPLSWADMDFVLEISQVEPWTYNGRKEQTSFRHFNVPSASKLGPNSRSIDCQLSYRPTRMVELREHAEFNEKGTGRGSTLSVIHDDSIDGKSKSLLSGTIHTDVQFHHEVDVYPNCRVHFIVNWSQVFGNNERNEFMFQGVLVW